MGYAFVFQDESEEEVSFGIGACVHPTAAGQGIGSYLLGKVEERTRQMALASGGVKSFTLVNEINGKNIQAQRLLEQEDYKFTRRSLFMEMALEYEPPAPSWPPGISVRQFVPGQDDQAMHRLMTTTFEGDRVRSFEEWQQEFQQRADFDASLWWFALHDATIIGGIMAYVSPEHGWIDHLGILAEWRKQGAGMALLRQALVGLYQCGVRQVALATASDNRTEAARLYERVGMQVSELYDIYQKSLLLSWQREPDE